MLLYLLPKNFISCLLGKLVSINLPLPLARMVNRAFARAAKINLAESERPIESYVNLQEFFIRQLKPGLRPIDERNEAIVSPCDGYLSISEKTAFDQLMQIKGRYYRLNDLLGDSELATRFISGHNATLYLSPRDYHRFHMPVDGDITQSYHIPGALWPVNRWAVTNIDQLFCQNERVVTIIKERVTQKLMAHIAVGACVVGRIALAYADFNQYKNNDRAARKIAHEPVTMVKGQELGRFMFGSTIILLMEPGLMTSFVKEAPAHVKMGEILGNLHVELSSKA